MKFRLLVIACCMVLAGCRFELPAFDSGRLEVHTVIDGRDRATIVALSSDQLKAISAWFATHRNGWRKSYVDAAPGKVAHFSKAGTPVAYFNLNGDILYAASYSRVLTQSERAELDAILNAKQG